MPVSQNRVSDMSMLQDHSFLKCLIFKRQLTLLTAAASKPEMKSMSKRLKILLDADEDKISTEDVF